MAKEKEKISDGKNRETNGIVGARWLSTRFFSRHWGAILAFVLLVMVYITNRYQCITAMETIQELEKELQIIKSENVRERSLYMSSTREMAMRKLVKEQGLDLEIRNQPPYKLEIKD